MHGRREGRSSGSETRLSTNSRESKRGDKTAALSIAWPSSPILCSTCRHCPVPCISRSMIEGTPDHQVRKSKQSRSRIYTTFLDSAISMNEGHIEQKTEQKWVKDQVPVRCSERRCLANCNSAYWSASIARRPSCASISSHLL